MDKARASAMALLLAALPTGVAAQGEGWDWALRELSVRVEVGDRSDAVRGVVRVGYVEPRQASAQGRYERPRDDRYGRDRDDYRDRYGYGERWDDRILVVRANAPAFCRSGAGHPVHGRRWCVEKGYGIGRVTAYGVRWERHDWRDVVFAGVWYRARATVLEGRALRNAVGRATWARLERERRYLGGEHPLTGRWLRPRSGVLVLQVRSGPLAIAELTDLNGDGRVDVVLVAAR